MGGGEGWGAEDRFFHIFDWKSSHCVSVEVHQQPQFTLQADTVTGSNLTPSVALLVYPSGTAQECGFHVKPLLGYQFLRDCSGFLQIHSHICKIQY